MKLGLGHQNSLENRRLAIDMAAQLVLWEKQTLETPPETLPSKRSREEAGLQVNSFASLLLSPPFIIGISPCTVEEKDREVLPSPSERNGQISYDCHRLSHDLT